MLLQAATAMGPRGQGSGASYLLVQYQATVLRIGFPRKSRKVGMMLIRIKDKMAIFRNGYSTRARGRCIRLVVELLAKQGSWTTSLMLPFEGLTADCIEPLPHQVRAPINCRLIEDQYSAYTQDFHSLTASSKGYQASSIHSRSKFRVKSIRLKGGASGLNARSSEEPRAFSPPPPLPPPPNPASKRPPRETRLLSDLWLTSAATFRRMGKLEQARGAIQEAEVLDEDNPAVWVQVRPPRCARVRTLNCYYS